MPDIQTAAERIALRLAERLREELWRRGGVKDHHIAASLLDLGLRVAVDEMIAGSNADDHCCPWCDRALDALQGVPDPGLDLPSVRLNEH